MNKKILLSVAAAATISTLLTGCGSSSTTSSEVDAASGNAQKAALSGATVTVGTATGRTAADGSWTATGTAVAADGDSVTVSGGDMVMVDDSLVPNTVTLKSTIDDENPENTVSIATTLIEELVATGDVTREAAQTAAMSLLGLSADSLFSQPDSLSVELKNKQVALWNLLTFVKTNPAGHTALIGGLQGAIASGGGDFAAIMDTLVDDVEATGMTTGVLRQTMAVIANNLGFQEEALLKTIYAANLAGVVVSAADIEANQLAYSNVLNLDTDNYALSSYGVDANLTYEGVDNITLPNTAAEFDANEGGIADLYFSLIDLSDVAPTGETGTLTIEMKNNNTNASFAMALSNLTVGSALTSLAGDTNKYVTLGMNENVSVSLTANSNTSVATHFSNSDLNITALSGTNLIESTEGDIELNLAAFANYVRTNAETDSSATNGNFSVDMLGNGNFSVKINADINSKEITFGSGTDAYNKAPKYKTTVDGVEYTGYKILDANLNK